MDAIHYNLSALRLIASLHTPLSLPPLHSIFSLSLVPSYLIFHIFYRFILLSYLIISLQHLKDRVRFEVTVRPQNSQIPESDPESSFLGVIFLTDVFPTNTVLDGKGDAMIDVTGLVSRNISNLLIINITDRYQIATIN